jgi:predicted nucleic acid-binding protein
LALFEFDLRLHQLGIDAVTRDSVASRYRELLFEVVNVDEDIRKEGVELKTSATARVSAVDTLIAATASVCGATLVHRDPHFTAIPANRLQQEMLPPKS